MKKLIIIAVLFCLSAMTFKTGAELKTIPDKDFEEFFTNFQKQLKAWKGMNNVWVLNGIIAWDVILKRNCNKEHPDISWEAGTFAYFYKYINRDYKTICNMSKKNKYASGGWSLNYMNSNESFELTSGEEVTGYARYGVHSGVYILNYNGGDRDGSVYCYFVKIDGEWIIVEFDFCC